MVYDTQDYWDFGLVHHPVFEKRQTNTTFWELYFFLSSGEGCENTYSVGAIRKS
jgi:hypothetical protein